MVLGKAFIKTDNSIDSVVMEILSYRNKLLQQVCYISYLVSKGLKINSGYP